MGEREWTYESGGLGNQYVTSRTLLDSYGPRCPGCYRLVDGCECKPSTPEGDETDG